MISDKTPDVYLPKSTETELDKQKTIMNKYMPVSYYEHHKLFSDKDVLKMMEEYRQQIEAKYLFKQVKRKEIETNPNEQNYPEATC
jgi:hypothetical protein